MIHRLRPFGGHGITGLGDALVDSLAAAIQQMEGYLPPGSRVGKDYYPNGTLAYQNNNPGNLQFNKVGYNYPGATIGVGGRFAKYPSYDIGVLALKHQIQFQIDKGQNLTQFFGVYAPPNENNTKNYIAQVAMQTGVDPSIPLKNYQNGTATTGVDSSSPYTPSPSTSSDYPDTTIVTDSSGGSGAGVLDSINDLDPVMIGAGVIIALGALYVAFG